MNLVELYRAHREVRGKVQIEQMFSGLHVKADARRSREKNRKHPAMGDGCVRIKKTPGWCSRVRSRRQQTLSSLAEKTARGPTETWPHFARGMSVRRVGEQRLQQHARFSCAAPCSDLKILL